MDIEKNTIPGNTISRDVLPGDTEKAVPGDTIPRDNSVRVRRLVLTGLLFALALILALVEDVIPTPVFVPGIKLGLSNIVVMYTMFFVGKRQALAIAVLKAGFVFLTRGLIASLLSLSGGLLSVAVMLLLLLIFGKRISYMMLSVAGAVCHNAGQLLTAAAIYTSLVLWGYLPVLVLSGIVAGAATSVLMRVTMPALNKLGLSK